MKCQRTGAVDGSTLAEELLGVALADVAHAGRRDRLDGRRPVALGDGHDPHALGIAPGRRDAPPDLRHPVGDVRHPASSQAVVANRSVLAPGPVAVPAAVAGGAARGVVDLVHPRLRQGGVDDRGQVEGRGAPGRGPAATGAEPVDEIVQLRPVELVAAGPDARTEVRRHRGVAQVAHGRGGPLDHAGEQTPPAGVDHTHRPPPQQHHGAQSAVRTASTQPGTVGDGGVGLRRRRARPAGSP